MWTFRSCLNSTAPLVVVNWLDVTQIVYPAMSMLLRCSSATVRYILYVRRGLEQRGPHLVQQLVIFRQEMFPTPFI